MIWKCELEDSMRYGRYEVRNVKNSVTNAGDTACFSLTLLVDGERFATVANDGWNGEHDIEPIAPFGWDDIRDEGRRMAEDHFLLDHPFDNFDSAVLTLVELHAAGETLQRHLKTKVVFIENDEYHAVGRGRSAPTDTEIARVKREHPEATVLNGMDIPAAAVLAVTAARELADRLADEEGMGMRR
jgi:hypothetical protein